MVHTVKKATVPSINVNITFPEGSQFILSAVPASWIFQISVLKEIRTKMIFERNDFPTCSYVLILSSY